MPTECVPDVFGFARVKSGRRVDDNAHVMLRYDGEARGPL
jgi:hypothetical protein